MIRSFNGIPLLLSRVPRNTRRKIFKPSTRSGINRSATALKRKQFIVERVSPPQQTAERCDGGDENFPDFLAEFSVKIIARNPFVWKHSVLKSWNRLSLNTLGRESCKLDKIMLSVILITRTEFIESNSSSKLLRPSKVNSNVRVDVEHGFHRKQLTEDNSHSSCSEFRNAGMPHNKRFRRSIFLSTLMPRIS